jgi:hypothetical protein
LMFPVTVPPPTASEPSETVGDPSSWPTYHGGCEDEVFGRRFLCTGANGSVSSKAAFKR